jgi:hypothetical protein
VAPTVAPTVAPITIPALLETWITDWPSTRPESFLSIRRSVIIKELASKRRESTHTTEGCTTDELSGPIDSPSGILGVVAVE